MTVGNETYDSLQHIPLDVGIETMIIWMTTVKSLMPDLNGNDADLVDYDDDDEFTEFEKRHELALQEK